MNTPETQSDNTRDNAPFAGHTLYEVASPASCNPGQAKEIRLAIRSLRASMKAEGIRVISCFNGGLSREEYSANAELFRLKTSLERLSK